MGGSRYPKRLVPSRGRYLSGMNLRTGGVRGVPGTCKGLVYRAGGCVCVCWSPRPWWGSPVCAAGAGRGQLAGPRHAEEEAEGAEPGRGEGAQGAGEGREAAGEAEEEGPGAAAELRGGLAVPLHPLPHPQPPPRGAPGSDTGHAIAAKGQRCQAETGTKWHVPPTPPPAAPSPPAPLHPTGTLRAPRGPFSGCK